MKTEFNLSDFVTEHKGEPSFILDFYIKEFIIRLKEEIKSNITGSEKFYNDNPENLLSFIDKLAGERLKENGNN